MNTWLVQYGRYCDVTFIYAENHVHVCRYISRQTMVFGQQAMKNKHEIRRANFEKSHQKPQHLLLG